MEYNITQQELVKFLQAVRDGVFKFSEFTSNTSVPELLYLECIKVDGVPQWAVHHLPIIVESIWNRYRDKHTRPDEILLTKNEKSTILMGCVGGSLETDMLPRIFPLIHKSIIGGVVYSGFTLDEYTGNGVLPDVPDDIKKEYEPILAIDGEWGICSTFIKENINKSDETDGAFDYSINAECKDKENIHIYNQILSGVMFFLN